MAYGVNLPDLLDHADVKLAHNVSIACYSSILSMLLNGAPLHEILHALVLKIEAQKIGTRGSILLLSGDGKRLLLGAAPHLPDSYNQAINGVEIGPNVGSCGTAAYLAKRVIVEDIATHPYWENYKELPLRAGLKSCWSEPIKDTQGKVLGTFAMYYDTIKSPTELDLELISEAARLASLAIERSRAMEFQRLAVKIFDRLPLALVISNSDDSVLYANPAFKHIVLPQNIDINNFNPKMFLSASQPNELVGLFEHLAQDKMWQGELVGLRGNGEEFYLDLIVSTFREPNGLQPCFAWLFSDISERKKAAQLIKYQANNDSLTGLANRNALFKQIQSLITSDSLTPGFSFMLMDLDNFKQVNDTHGHDKGDALLVQVVRQICECLNDTMVFARLGGDEFALLLPGIVNQKELAQLAETINKHVAKRYVLADGKGVYSSVSIGIARFPEDALDLEQLLNCADQAMYISKANGRNRYHFFTEQMQLNAERIASLHNQLKQALDQQTFELYYQPIVNATTGLIVRAEVLLRWQHEGQFIPPDEFIPIAENSGLIVDIGRDVRLGAMQTILEMQAHNWPINLSVNVSTFEFWSHELQDAFVDSFAAITEQLEVTDFPYDRLTLEITESLLMKQHTHLIDVLNGLRIKGIKISLDDFGTGYSSLSYLANFPIDQIKIDKSFIDRLDEGKRHEALVEAIVRLSHALDLTVTAEGVETESQLKFVMSNHIQEIQGYLFYKPMPKVAFFALLAKQAELH
ncbi:EAL domain-containing protein [Shewanella baltica]|uniref:sensor domain-containing phosphodiesterase n=1 Tax=Shewanella baltica TaxID=62322 RepID=UPI00217CEA6E|nr:EAL domain-containing protein [Shewanella baltica]MCS6129484.1 EAL domain-containing protein [Shewanella baltica]MCS6141272.1 EAL domain-containing protein [Shewanella baltica]MCS6147556.1 EAL domain-containing protein [Shewanella baltica]MCS6172085.1 EAL domain-containing protein [Shewanella baltica]MCS6189310.1 EAL domain-containing protein [Shewanella baltica]